MTRVHGYANKERLYRIWKNMRRRCNNTKSDYYENYGGRGIRVCSQWDDYFTFRKWAISNGYKNDLTIDRINNDGNYTPSNCKWSTRKQQSNNTRSNVVITYKGVTKTASEWAEHLGLSKAAIYHRIERNWNEKDIIEVPENARRKKNSPKAVFYEYEGEKKTLKELSQIKGIKPSTIKYRIKKGWSVEKAVNKAVMKNQYG